MTYFTFKSSEFSHLVGIQNSERIAAMFDSLRHVAPHLPPHMFALAMYMLLLYATLQ